MRKYYKLDNNGAVIATADIAFPQPGYEIYDFPNDFDFSKQSNFTIADGVLSEIPADKREKIATATERNRPLTEAEVSRMLLTQQVNSLVVDDNTAVRMMAFYPAFESIVGVTVKQGYKFTYGDKLWRVIQPTLTIQAHYPPSIDTASLYTEINETHDGTIDDPIPYNGNMALVSGKYYYQSGVIYLCTLDTINPVYQPLKELVGNYVEVY